jgi:hypothetical protein
MVMTFGTLLCYGFLGGVIPVGLLYFMNSMILDEIILTCYSAYEECIFIFINEIMFFFLGR